MNPRLIKQQMKPTLVITINVDEKTGAADCQCNKPADTFYLIQLLLNLAQQLVMNSAKQMSMIIKPGRDPKPIQPIDSKQDSTNEVSSNGEQKDNNN